MVCPTPRSGKWGFVGDYTDEILTRFARVRNWTFNEIENAEERRYAGTMLGMQRLPGVINSFGSFEGFGANPPLFAGDLFTFLGYTAPTSGIPCTTGCAASVLAYAASVSITWDWTAENKGVTWAVNFVSNGAVTNLPTFLDNCDFSTYCDPSPCNLQVLVNTGCNPAEVEWCNITTATLTYTAEMQEYSNSSTACNIKREPSGLDFTLEVVDQNPCKILSIGTDYRVRIQASSTPTYWDLQFARMMEVNNWQINPQTGAIITKNNVLRMQAVLCCSPPVRGSILKPGGTYAWPFQVLNTVSNTPSSTPSPSTSPSGTSSGTPSNTVSNTPSSTQSASATESNTPSSTQSASATVSNTPSTSPSRTPSATPSRTPSATAGI